MLPLTNRLGDSPSLYLRQHATNPVYWQPWDEIALGYARENQKLLLISIGYAACHWCHVMEHECFEDQAVAEQMNTAFVSIKIDRESRPDLDAVYMEALQLMTGRGGWPLNIIALPDGRPVYGGTYFPKEQWQAVLQQISTLWTKEPERVRAYADHMEGALIEHQLIKPAGNSSLPDIHFYNRSFGPLAQAYDAHFGGMSPAPKFPMPVLWRYMLKYGVLAKNQDAIDNVHFTLERMAAGGLYDQLGGGFARYSVDPYWKVPHFEKMLYDNAQLVTLYAEAYRQSSHPRFKEVVQNTLDWCKSHLLQKNGAYAAAFDADSEGVEGKYYVWTTTSISSCLGQDELALATHWFGLEDEAIWEEGLLVLQVAKTPAELAKILGKSERHIQETQAKIRQKLLSERDKRIPPACDSKQLLGWNALLLEGLAEAYISLQVENYLVDALALANALLQFKVDGQWYRVVYEDALSQPAFSEDLAYLAQAFFRLYQVSGDPSWLLESEKLVLLLQTDFSDRQTGLLLYGREKALDWHADRVELADNVQPSANSVYAHLLYQLASLHADTRQQEQALALFRLAQTSLEKHMRFYAGWGSLGLDIAYGTAVVSLTGNDAAAAYRELAARYLAGETLLWSVVKQTYPPLLAERYSNAPLRIDRCIFGSCALPLTSVAAYLAATAQS